MVRKRIEDISQAPEPVLAVTDVASSPMAAFINMPADLLADPKTAQLDPPLKRMLVTVWAICDHKGRVSESDADRAAEHWGDAMYAEDRLDLPDILADLQRLGFLRDLQKRGDSYQFRRSGGWLS
ncbi:MAG: hypothetical protein ACLP1X_11810 [Polyangiaceae bacterium]